MAAAANLLGRATELLPDGHSSRPHLLLEVGHARHETGAFDEALAAYDASRLAATGLGDPAAAEAAGIENLRLQYLIGRLDDERDVEAEVNAALDRLASLGNPDALSRAWQLRLNVEINACRWAAAQVAANAVIEQAHQAGNLSLASPGAGEAGLNFKNYAKPGDSMVLDFAMATKKLSGVNVNTYLADPSQPITLAVQFATLPDGTNYPARIVMNAPAKNVQVTTTNSNYMRLAS
jgi:hypothetical protein